MSAYRWALLTAAGVLGILATVAPVFAQTFEEQNEALFQALEQVHGLSGEQLAELRAIFRRSGYMGQGNPAIARHPQTPQQCRARLEERGIDHANPEFERICGAKYMAPLYDPAREAPGDAQACIDQFEFPNIPCEYPVVWVKAREAAEVCAAQGKRLCDAHEWEGACAGALQEPDYRFDLAKGVSPNAAVARMAQAHNAKYSPTKSWSYGPDYQKGICAAGSQKSPGCEGGGWNRCGSNTYPTGAFPDCRSSLAVYDLNGNAAEHMNLPLDPSQMASQGSKTLGYTEMKGSWFIFDSYRAHPDWCRWRAPYWHGSRVLDPASHENYHLGFRCCRSLAEEPGAAD
jgi:formylglycine-generating enzyme required for sulfatase activity